MPLDAYKIGARKVRGWKCPKCHELTDALPNDLYDAEHACDSCGYEGVGFTEARV